MSNGYSLELVMKIYNDNTGEAIEVGEDKDGLGMVEILYRDDKGKIGDRLSLEPEQIPYIIEALTKVSESIGAKS